MTPLESKSINFLLADDHSLIRQGVVFIIEEMELDCEIYQASNLHQTLEFINKFPIDIAIIDANFPDGNSLNVLPEIKKISPDTKILIFTGIDEGPQSLKYLTAGANGFLSKMNDEEEIKNAILKMVNSGAYISPITQALLIDSIRNPAVSNPLLLLTERELQIAKMYAEGQGNLEIANSLDVKQNTVSTLKKRIFDKLEIENIVELIELIKDHQ
ncbi:MAG TPA: response regulator transcription factor [Kaistella chaponensis]|jgi:DNA-binding NarL/FixJ family response regulator|uniref:response regulator transcription factor n=1 Tax=Kaistella chaponensis TaxID=713588 RepID=UPI002BF8852C|nr:response regulator transcription factor [Kaistella chaponensis]HPW89092.1 response regulator transcription factor [Kaistella chaponensis]